MGNGIASPAGRAGVIVQGLSLHVSLRHDCDHKSRPIFTRLRGERGQSEHRRVLGDSGDGGGSDSLALFGSTEHEGFVNSKELSHQYGLFKD